MFDRRGRLTIEERQRLFRFALFSVILTSIPYLLAFARAGEDSTFSGFLFGVDDGNSYIAKMLAGSQGAWSFKTPYTTFPQGGLFGLFLPYILLGKLAGGAALHLQLVLLFQGFRILAGFVMIYGVYDFIAFFEPRPTYRLLGAILATFGGGLGWLMVLIGQGNFAGTLPLDFYSPETFGFLSFFGLPHLALSRGLMLWGMLAWMDPGEQSPWRTGVGAAGCWIAAAIFNPLSPAIALLVSGTVWVYVLIQANFQVKTIFDNRFKSFAIAAAMTLPVVAYFAALSAFDPFFKAWSAQNTITSPHPLHYVAAFGLFLPFVFKGARRLLKTGDAFKQIPLAWIILLPVLVYIPINLQRRLAEGVFVAVVILAIRGMDFEGKSSRLKRSLVVTLFIPTTLLLFSGSLIAAWEPGLPVFRPVGETAAFAFLAEQIEPGDVVLATVSSGNALPAFAPARVVIGHGPETIGFLDILPRAALFYDNGMSASEAAEFLAEFEVRYVFWPVVDLMEYEHLKLIYEADGYQIYQVED